jgi:penicillin-binding protein 1B
MVLGASTAFLVLSTVLDVCLAGLYARSVTRLDTAASLEDREARVFARPIRLIIGRRFDRSALEHHLDRIGFFRTSARERGCYTSDEHGLTLFQRYPEFPDVTITWHDDLIERITTSTGNPVAQALIEPETILTAAPDSTGAPIRTVNRPIPVAVLEGTPLLDAILASEDRTFETHHGLDLARLALVPFTGGGASTLTMQVARLDVLGDRRRTLERKMNEIGIAMAIERRYSKQTILTAYINTVYLGVSAGRSVHGFAAAAREFFGVDDVRDLTPLQAATLVALLNRPSRYFDDLRAGDETRLRRQRNRVLRLMHKNFPSRYTDAWVRSLEHESILLSSPSQSDDAVYRVSRHYLDFAMPDAAAASRTYLTLDPSLQHLADQTVHRGLAVLERSAPRLAGRIDAALVATNPLTGEVLAMIGGRSYDQSQFNRAAGARRQIGSIMKPFDYLAAFERAADEDRTDLSPSTLVLDIPTTFTFPGLRPWTPANYKHEYRGAVTWRQALAESRNVAAVRVAISAGIDRVASLWENASGQRLHHVYPAIALGAVEATPVDVARAYAIFATGGITKPLRTSIRLAPEPGTFAPSTGGSRVSRPQTTAIVAEMMRAVLDEGTGRGARLAGFTLDAAGKTGTTDELRDAWFAGFAKNLLTVVWVGRDDNRPLGLTGAQAALPIWTEFMKQALVPDDRDASAAPAALR